MAETQKNGRARKKKNPYRYNLVRIGVLEDTLLRMLDKLNPDSPLRKIVKDELADLRLRETQKVIAREMRGLKN